MTALDVHLHPWDDGWELHLPNGVTQSADSIHDAIRMTLSWTRMEGETPPTVIRFTVNTETP